jgi:hypothetical protein
VGLGDFAIVGYLLYRILPGWEKHEFFEGESEE